MRFPLPNKPRHWTALGVIAPMLVVLFLISGFFQWSPLNCWHEDIDINTGRVRRTRFLLYLQIDDHIEDTWLSSAINNPTPSPDWRRVNTFSPGVGYSPHYLFHGALYQIKILELADSIIPFDPDARLQVADKLRELWQLNGSSFKAGTFAEKVSETAQRLYENGASVVRATEVPGGS